MPMIHDPIEALKEILNISDEAYYLECENQLVELSDEDIIEQFKRIILDIETIADEVIFSQELRR